MLEAGPETAQKRFQTLLRELFQFDCADLDFGIYRIMNHKRRVIDSYINRDLPKAIDTAVDQGAVQTVARRARTLKDTRETVVNNFGESAIAPSGKLLKYRDTPLGKKYILWRKRARHAESAGDVRRDIYNHLYSFFSRYYQDGDFIPKRRYSREHPYIVPYDGQDVHFHWANRDQYYVKSAEHFKDYKYRTGSGVSVHFSLHSADVEQDDVKPGAKHFFLPLLGDLCWDAKRQALDIPFEYRPLTSVEEEKFGTTRQQDKILERAEMSIRRDAAMPLDVAKALLSAPPPPPKSSRSSRSGRRATRFTHHARRFAQTVKSDFFIHRNLRRFLERELGYYLRSEVLSLSSLAAGDEVSADAWLDKMRVIREIGRDVIEFLAQIEGFQKALWEKRKFVVDTQYCIQVGLVPMDLVPRILECEPQWEEWRLLGCITDDGQTLFTDGTGPFSRSDFLEHSPGVMLDTRHFDSDFVDYLLSTLSDLDEITDGLAIKSENWQALNLIGERYSGELSCVYIDPPYNTAASAILYKNEYKDSSWLALMENRLRELPRFLVQDGIICVAIDDVEYANLYALVSATFGRQSLLATAIVRSNPSGRSTPTGFSSCHEYALFVKTGAGARVGRLPRSHAQTARYREMDDRGRFTWEGFRKHGGMNAYRIARPKLYYPLYVNRAGNIRVPSMTWSETKRQWLIQESPRDDETTVWPIRPNPKLEKMTWKWKASRVNSDPHRFRAQRLTDGGMRVQMKSYMKEGTLPTTWWSNSKYSAAEHGTSILKNLFGHARHFSFPKSVRLIEDCVRACGCGVDSTVLDCFAGSGTTGHSIISLNRADGGRRKFILVEMGHHFDTVLLPRLKKIAFCPGWKGGAPDPKVNRDDANRGPRIIKYFRMETFEDALNNIEFDQSDENLLGIEDYTLRYMLQWETKRSRTLLNVEALDRPFDYKLRLNGSGGGVEMAVDLPETFNYLLGLIVHSRRVYYDGECRYLVYSGRTRDGQKRATVIWRDTEGWTLEDRKRDREFVAENDLTQDVDTIWMNGDSMVPGAHSLDEVFKQRMFPPAH